MMIHVVVNRELGRDYFHLLSNNSDVGRIHVHFLQCGWHWSSYDTCLERHQWVNTGHTFKTPSASFEAKVEEGKEE